MAAQAHEKSRGQGDFVKSALRGLYVNNFNSTTVLKLEFDCHPYVRHILLVLLPCKSFKIFLLFVGYNKSSIMSDEKADKGDEEKVYGGCEGPDAMYVKLVSSDGHEFIVKRDHALTSGTIKAMLSGPGKFKLSLVSDVSNIRLINGCLFLCTERWKCVECYPCLFLLSSVFGRTLHT